MSKENDRVCSICVAVFFFLVNPVSGNLMADPISPSKGKVLAEYELLMKTGCDLNKYSIGTPIETRVLRNIPFALAGYKFKSEELSALFLNDGDWYKPQEKALPHLSRKDARCVAKLKKLEWKLRKKLPIDKKIEQVITRHPAVFLSLRKGVQSGSRFGKAKGKASLNKWSWSFVDFSACGGDGSPGSEGDCSGFYVSCELPEGSNDLKKLDCIASWAG